LNNYDYMVKQNYLIGIEFGILVAVSESMIIIQFKLVPKLSQTG